MEIEEIKAELDELTQKKVAMKICDLYEQRKNNRRHREKVWDEIDRQLRQEPDISFKMTNGRKDPLKAWLPETELPYQSQALEITTADVRRLMFPDQGAWFQGYAELSDEYMNRAEAIPIVGGEVAKVDQESANQIVESWMMWVHDQYDFKMHYDLINADVIKYGTSAPRERIVKKKVFMMADKGIMSREMEIPVLVPRSIRDVYLDDSQHHLHNEGIEIAPSVIQKKRQMYDDLVMAAKKGVKDPKKENGGWMEGNLDRVEKDKDNCVDVLEFEGDLVVPQNQKSIFVPNVIITVVTSKKNKGGVIVRMRFNRFETCSYVPHHYHLEDCTSPYGSSPLTKGMPLQVAATEALNRLMVVGAFNALPPTTYDKDDPTYAKTGGPVLYPGASIGSTGDISTLSIGDPQAMLAVYSALVNQYEQLTGTQSPRLGAQTTSHTTAFAKQQELARGTIRTVDYVRSVNNGPMYKHLQMTYEMSKKLMGNKDYAVFNHSTKSYIETLNKDHLPDNVHFDVFGASTPGEDAAQSGAEVNALQGVLNIEMIKQQLGQGRPLNLDEVQKRFLEKAKVNDIEQLYTTTSGNVSQGVAAGPQNAGAGGVDPGAAGLILQNLGLQG